MSLGPYSLNEFDPYGSLYSSTRYATQMKIESSYESLPTHFKLTVSRVPSAYREWFVSDNLIISNGEILTSFPENPYRLWFDTFLPAWRGTFILERSLIYNYVSRFDGERTQHKIPAYWITQQTGGYYSPILYNTIYRYPDSFNPVIPDDAQQCETVSQWMKVYGVPYTFGSVTELEQIELSKMWTLALPAAYHNQRYWSNLMEHIGTPNNDRYSLALFSSYGHMLLPTESVGHPLSTERYISHLNQPTKFYWTNLYSGAEYRTVPVSDEAWWYIQGDGSHVATLEPFSL